MRLMDGSARFSAIRRSTPAVLLLILAGNLVPLGGVLFLGWDVGTILVLYWIENGIVGLFNAARMLLAQMPDKMGKALTLGGKVFDTLFFVAHYGLFWFVHGVFVLTLTGFAVGARPSPLTLVAGALGTPVVLVGSLALLVSHASAFYYDYLGKAEYRTTSPTRQMWRPYPRLISLHLTITIGGVALLEQPQPENSVALVTLLVAFKTVAEIGLYLADRFLAPRWQAVPSAD